jgi:hypothetical protein
MSRRRKPGWATPTPAHVGDIRASNDCREPLGSEEARGPTNGIARGRAPSPRVRRPRSASEHASTTHRWIRPRAARTRYTEGTRAGTGRREPFADVATPSRRSLRRNAEARSRSIEVPGSRPQAATWSRTTTALLLPQEKQTPRPCLPRERVSHRGRRDACADAIARVGQRPGQRDEGAQEAAQLSDRMRAVGGS